MMFLAVYLPFIIGLASGYLLNEIIRLRIECTEIEKDLKKNRG
jgi:hypothetical protein